MEKYRWARQDVVRKHLRESERLAEWNRLAREARAAPDPAPAPPARPDPAPAARTEPASGEEEAARDEMDYENRWRRMNDLEEWTWPEWKCWHRLVWE